ncbi:hypothetical protein MTO96_026386 [Rhipicephalus appendiculatus]
MEVILRLSGALLIAGGGLSQSFQSRLNCHRLMPPALTSIMTPCRFPCGLNYRENSYSIVLGYDPDGTPCHMGRCRGGVCLQLRYYTVLESFRGGLSSKSRVYTNHERAETDEHVGNHPIVTSRRYGRINILRKASSNRNTGHVPTNSGNHDSDSAFRTSTSMALAPTHMLLRDKRAVPRMGVIQKKPGGSFKKQNMQENIGFRVPHHRGHKGRGKFNDIKHHLGKHKKKYILGALAAAVGTTAVSLKAAKIAVKPECRNGRRKCDKSNEDETEEDYTKHSTKTKKTHRKKSTDDSNTETAKESEHKGSKHKSGWTQTHDTGKNGKESTVHDEKERR